MNVTGGERFTSLERGSSCLSVCVSLCYLSAWRPGNACPGNRVGVKEKSWGAGSELLAGVLCWAGCAVCFYSEADRKTENGEGEEQGEHSRVDASHCPNMKACPHFWNSPFRKQVVCIFSFPSPCCFLGINLCSVSQWCCIEGFQGLHGETFRCFVRIWGYCRLNTFGILVVF